MKTNKLIALLLSLLIGFNTVGVCYGEEVENEVPVVQENTGNKSDKQFYGYVPSDLDYNTPVIDQLNSGIAPIGTLVPSSYQYDVNEIKAKYPDVRNQNPYGTCWSFSSLGMMEFDLINKGQFTRDNDLSELQLAYFTFNNVQDPLGGTKGDTAKYYNENASNTYLNYGGNYEYSIRRLSQWIGATNESVVPYSNADSTKTNGLDSSLAYNYNSAYLKNAYLINIKQNSDNVKEMIMKHGSVGVMYNHWNDGMTQVNGVNAYFDNGKQTNAGGTHAVMIVGWDDNYSKDNFHTAEKPTKNGAWLVRNSWGIYFSYFWMSYETSSLSDTAYAFDCQNTKPYDNNYQLDGGLESYLYTNASSVYNKFTVQKTDGVESETLKAISVSFTKAANVNYTIDIYTSMYDKGKPETGTKVVSISDKTTYAGVYTIPLGTQNEVKLKPGSEFYVVVTTDKPAVDCETAYSIVDDPNSENPKSIWSKAVSQYDYNSYFKIDGSTRYQASQNNFRIKAYTTNNSKTQNDISNAVIAKNDDFTLDNPSVKVTYEDVELKKGTDYTISTTTDANGITVTVSGQGDYTGTLSKKFISISSLTVKCKDIAYTGSEVKPAITVKYDNATLKLDEDYTVNYSNNVKVSEKAIATIKGKGDYFGSIEVPFQIYNDIGETPKIYSLGLNGLIEFNFYFGLSDKLLKDEGAYVLFTLPDGREQKQYINDAIYKDGMYKFTCGVYAKEMTQKITIQMINGNGVKGRKYSYSIEDYTNSSFKSNSETSIKERKLLKSMLNYGGYAQDEFNAYLDNKAYKNVKSDFEEEMNSISAGLLSQYKGKILSKDKNISPNIITLLLEESTSLRVYFNVKDEKIVNKYEISIDGKKGTLEKNSKGYYVEISSIPSNKLDVIHTIKIGDLSIECSALSFVYSAINSNSNSMNALVSKALYIYFKQSKAYFG